MKMQTEQAEIYTLGSRALQLLRNIRNADTPEERDYWQDEYEKIVAKIAAYV